MGIELAEQIPRAYCFLAVAGSNVGIVVFDRDTLIPVPHSPEQLDLAESRHAAGPDEPEFEGMRQGRVSASVCECP